MVDDVFREYGYRTDNEIEDDKKKSHPSESHALTAVTSPSSDPLLTQCDGTRDPPDGSPTLPHCIDVVEDTFRKFGIDTGPFLSVDTQVSGLDIQTGVLGKQTRGGHEGHEEAEPNITAVTSPSSDPPLAQCDGTRDPPDGSPTLPHCIDVVEDTFRKFGIDTGPFLSVDPQVSGPGPSGLDLSVHNLQTGVQDKQKRADNEEEAELNVPKVARKCHGPVSVFNLVHQINFPDNLFDPSEKMADTAGLTFVAFTSRMEIKDGTSTPPSMSWTKDYDEGSSISDTECVPPLYPVIQDAIGYLDPVMAPNVNDSASSASSQGGDATVVDAENKKLTAETMFNLIVATARESLENALVSLENALVSTDTEMFWSGVSCDNCTSSVHDRITDLKGYIELIHNLEGYKTPSNALSRQYDYTTGCFSKYERDKRVALRDAATGFLVPNNVVYKEALQSLGTPKGCKMADYLRWIDVGLTRGGANEANEATWLETQLKNVFGVIDYRNITMCKYVTENYTEMSSLTICMGVEVDELLALVLYANHICDQGKIHVRLPRDVFYHQRNIYEKIKTLFGVIASQTKSDITIMDWSPQNVSPFANSPISRTISTQLEYFLGGANQGRRGGVWDALRKLEEAARFYEPPIAPSRTVSVSGSDDHQFDNENHNMEEDPPSHRGSQESQ